MARSDGSSSQDDQQTEKAEKKPIAINISVKIPRRKAALITITLLLNVLHWSSIICLSTSIYHISSNPDDTTSIPVEVLTLISVRNKNHFAFMTRAHVCRELPQYATPIYTQSYRSSKRLGSAIANMHQRSKGRLTLPSATLFCCVLYGS